MGKRSRVGEGRGWEQPVTNQMGREGWVWEQNLNVYVTQGAGGVAGGNGEGKTRVCTGECPKKKKKKTVGGVTGTVRYGNQNNRSSVQQPVGVANVCAQQ